ncbi:MAG: toll/interleukin-1 receptor domain-containing protein, partial [Rubrivivax sp.]|nr:toll/interleukin-1 receptor domain-containing protein [Rubrivivax sp.]
MKIFLSYPSARRELALRLKLALEAEQHEVFFDRDDLAAGDAFHQPIRDALAASELFIFFVSPESVAAGNYTLAELGQAESNWPRPAGRVLPVLVAPTPRGDIPPYLLAVTL